MVTFFNQASASVCSTCFKNDRLCALTAFSFGNPKGNLAIVTSSGSRAVGGRSVRSAVEAVVQLCEARAYANMILPQQHVLLAVS